MTALAAALAGGLTLRLLGGFAFLDVVPGLPAAPLLTGEAQLGWSPADRIDLRLRYATHLGVVHRLGPDLRVTALRLGDFSLGARLHPSARIGGTPEDVAGDLSTQAAVLLAWRAGATGVDAELGATVQWLLYEHIDGRSHTDGEPYLASIDVAIEVERALASGVVLVGRLELAVPAAPDDPFAVLGVHPRVLFGAAWRP